MFSLFRKIAYQNLLHSFNEKFMDAQSLEISEADRLLRLRHLKTKISAACQHFTKKINQTKTDLDALQEKIQTTLSLLQKSRFILKRQISRILLKTNTDLLNQVSHFLNITEDLFATTYAIVYPTHSMCSAIVNETHITSLFATKSNKAKQSRSRHPAGLTPARKNAGHSGCNESLHVQHHSASLTTSSGAREHFAEDLLPKYPRIEEESPSTSYVLSSFRCYH